MIIADRSGERFGLGSIRDYIQAVTQPLDCRAGNEDTAFERVFRLPVPPPGNRREQPGFRRPGLMAGVHEQETACAISVLHHSGFETCLSEESRLLITCIAGNRD